jgi:hypothetical protein
MAPHYGKACSLLGNEINGDALHRVVKVHSDEVDAPFNIKSLILVT